MEGVSNEGIKAQETTYDEVDGQAPILRPPVRRRIVGETVKAQKTTHDEVQFYVLPVGRRIVDLLVIHISLLVPALAIGKLKVRDWAVRVR